MMKIVKEENREEGYLCLPEIAHEAQREAIKDSRPNIQRRLSMR